MKKKKLNFNASLVASDAADVIGALTEGLKEKRLHFQKGDDELLLKLDEAVNLSIEARYKDGKAKVTVEVMWDVPQKSQNPESTNEDANSDSDDEQGLSESCACADASKAN